MRNLLILTTAFLSLASLESAALAAPPAPAAQPDLLTIHMGTKNKELGENPMLKGNSSWTLNVTPTAGDATQIDGIAILGPSTRPAPGDRYSLKRINGGFDLTPLPNFLNMKGQNVSATAGGSVILTYFKVDGTSATQPLRLQLDHGWFAADESGKPIKRCDIDLDMNADATKVGINSIQCE